MKPEVLIQQLKSTREWFDRSTRCLTEDDSAFAPSEGMFTTAQQVAHVAWTVNWFLDGAFRNAEGFDLDFDKEKAALAKVTSLAEARGQVEQAFADAEEEIGKRSAAELAEPLPPGPVMGGAPRGTIVGAIGDHTSHHRGALTVYSRLRGHTPPMPYMEM
jgi:uncharacterized damage-inducible protein DinB